MEDSDGKRFKATSKHCQDVNLSTGGKVCALFAGRFRKCDIRKVFQGNRQERWLLCGLQMSTAEIPTKQWFNKQARTQDQKETD